ncbi:11177_t:CDS:2 [Paraglomus brasilianum]|uniref:11177_t:CDS:1 n=1 Tax=Paraglomus brasilianum TaxID=144538 RepID=A0A9N9C8S9_9GLOM|nr:11177_t:CDS:2 [Paraglomus brasilianum]
MKKVMGCVVLTKYMESAKQDEEEDMQEWLRTFIHSGKRYMTETCYKRLANVGKVKIKLHCELEEE